MSAACRWSLARFRPSFSPGLCLSIVAGIAAALLTLLLVAESAAQGPGRGGRKDAGERDGKGGGQRERQHGGQPAGGKSEYTLDQAISDRAQLNTIAFSGVAFLSGDFAASTFIPPGKVCDYFGFQYLRDIDAAKKGHNPLFLNRVTGNLLQILSAEQKRQFNDLAAEQAPQLEQLARLRLPLIKAFVLQRDGEIPAGGASLNRHAVVAHVGALFQRDAELSLRRAEVMAAVYRSLTDEQRASLAKMKFGDFDSWPAVDQRDLPREKGRKGSKLQNIAYLTYISEFYSWTAGSVDADVYFCPERHGTYFGGFFMKDLPAMGRRDFDISTALTADSGHSLLNEVLLPPQRKTFDIVIERQRPFLTEIVEVRRQIALELRKLLAGQTPDRVRVLELGKRYGECDGEMSWLYAMAFAHINRSLTDSQRTAIKKLRNLDIATPAQYYLFSHAESSPPELGDVDRFFREPAGDRR